MKNILLVLAAACSINAVCAQQFVTELFQGEIAQFEDIEIEFVEVLNDSRCPANVDCIQAGKAVVLVNVYEGGEFVEDRELVFFPSGVVNNRNVTLVAYPDISITGLELHPYPEAHQPIRKEDYALVLSVQYQ